VYGTVHDIVIVNLRYIYIYIRCIYSDVSARCTVRYSMVWDGQTIYTVRSRYGAKGWKLCLFFAAKGHFGSFFQNTNFVTYISPMLYQDAFFKRK